MSTHFPRAASALALLLLSLPAAADVFINEIHYDEPGSTDANERFEVVATGGEDLSSYRIVLYNGNGGGQYDDINLPAGSSVSCGGSVQMATYDATAAGGQIQNGNPDGMALVGPSDVVIQFLSYEGSFTASGGPANGMLSEDIGVAEDNSGASGQSLQLSGNGSTYDEFTWVGEADDTFGQCNNGQTFGAPVDNPPTLFTSTPTNGANDFPVNGNLVLTFSEAVSLGASWFEILCNGSGNRNPANVAVSGGPSVFTLDPNTDFVASESCTLNLNTAAIADQDDTPDALVDPGSITFSPAPDAPPVVLSTTPMDGSSNFPSAADIVVLFSENVNLASGAFDLSCTSSTGISLSHANSGTSFSINTGTALIAGDSCTFRIDRSKVTDSLGQNPAADTVINFSVANTSAGTYYDSVNTSSPEQLRCSLHNLIKGHTVYPYSSGGTGDTWEILNTADEDPVDTSKILDAYKNESYTKINGGTGAYNREHTWPNSLGFGSSSLAAYTDTHMLYLTNVGYNSDRGNKPYINCGAGCTERTTALNHGEGGGSGTYPGNSNWFNGSGFEVWDHRKGDMARAVMYMAIRYEGIASEDAHDGNIPDLELTDNASLIVGTSNTAAKAYMGLLSVLLQWNQNDPPDDRERDRNGIVYSFQGNRNPFIDHPEWATVALFTSSQPAVCSPASATINAQGDSYNASEDAVLNIAAPGVLDNDSNSDPITSVTVQTDVSHGSLSLNLDGSFAYTPTGNYCGADSFTYSISDGSISDSATVSLTVACVEDGAAPAQDDTLNLAQDSSATVDVLANDGSDPDPEQNPLSIASVSTPAHGATSVLVGGIQYTPESGYCGVDSFDYVLNGGGSATVTVSITCANGAPSADADAYAVDEDQSLNVSALNGVLANDSDPENDAVTAVLDQTTQHGNLNFNADGSFDYTPTANYCGADSFSYHANDGTLNSASATVSLTINCVNDAPSTNPDSHNGDQGHAQIVSAPGVLGNDSDIDGDSLTAVLDTDVQHGSLSLNADGSYSYVPANGYCGNDSFSYHAFDGSAASPVQVVSLSISCNAGQVFTNGFE